MQVVTRREALSTGASFYFTGKPCKHGHVDLRLKDGHCVSCRHSKETLAGYRRWQRNNPDARAAIDGISYARRRAPGSVPVGLTYHDVLTFYTEARALTHETGVSHEVDHIVSLTKGGAHAPDNLQVLTKAENRAKGDR